MERLSLLELTKELVGHNTSPGNSNNDIINFVANYCEDIGFSVKKDEYKGDEGINQFNLVATIGGKGRPILGLSGHTDTVKFTKESGKSGCWSDGIEPLSLTEKDGKYYGLGVADMKLFLAMVLKASETIDVKQMRRPLALYFSAEEEVGCCGISHLLPKDKPLVEVANYVIVGEPTEMKPAIAHKGYFYFQVVITATVDETNPKVRKQITHSSNDTRATNVVEVILPKITTALTELRDLLRGHTDYRFKIPYPTFNIGGKIDYPENAMKNVIPVYISVDCELRSLPFQDQDHLRYLLERYVRESIVGLKMVNPDEVPSAIVKFVRKEPTPAMDTSEDSLIAEYTKKVSRTNGFKYLLFNTEGGIFNRAGAQSIIWGPGSINDAHHKDEFVLKKWMSQKYVDKYIALIRHFCYEEV